MKPTAASDHLDASLSKPDTAAVWALPRNKDNLILDSGQIAELCSSVVRDDGDLASIHSHYVFVVSTIIWVYKATQEHIQDIIRLCVYTYRRLNQNGMSVERR